MPRAVLDPGILIAALLSPKGAPAGVLLAWLEGRFQLVVCPHLLSELEKVLSRPKFRRYLTKEEVTSYARLLRNAAILVPDSTPQPGITPDPGDDYLVALARESGAEFLVSGDPHLTGLRRVRPRVVTLRAFLDMLQRV